MRLYGPRARISAGIEPKSYPVRTPIRKARCFACLALMDAADLKPLRPGGAGFCPECYDAKQARRNPHPMGGNPLWAAPPAPADTKVCHGCLAQTDIALLIEHDNRRLCPACGEGAA